MATEQQGGMKPPSQNRRRVPRYPCKGEARIRTEEAPKGDGGEVNQVSEGGCYISTPHPAPAGTNIELQLQIGEEQIQTRGVVLYSHQARGMGVAFVQTSEETRDFLEELLTALARSLPEA